LVLALWSVAAHLSGSYWDDGRWNGYALPAGLWRWTDSPLVNPARVLLGRAEVAVADIPTSRSAAELMAAALVAAPAPLPVQGQAGRQIRINLEVKNTGDAVWLAWPKRAEGSVRLSWELLPRDGGSTPRRAGRMPLRRDVFPADEYDFQIPIVLPASTGNYELHLDLTVNRGPRLSEIGYGPLVIPVRVTERRPE
jgi:hypothetical protein